MKRLAKKIIRDLETETASIGHCAVYDSDLQRLWPLDVVNRKQKIVQFANQVMVEVFLLISYPIVRAISVTR